MTAEERIKQLEEQLSQAFEHIGILQEQLAGAHKRIEELEKQKMPAAAFVKANVLKPQGSEKKARQKRDPLAPVLGEAPDLAGVLARLARRMGGQA